MLYRHKFYSAYFTLKRCVGSILNEYSYLIFYDKIYYIFLGSIMAVSSSNQHAPNKSTRFVGICIQRLGCGLRANFTLRNVIKHIGK